MLIERGMKIRLKPREQCVTALDGTSIIEEMDEYFGREHTVCDVGPSGRFTTQECPFILHPDWVATGTQAGKQGHQDIRLIRKSTKNRGGSDSEF